VGLESLRWRGDTEPALAAVVAAVLLGDPLDFTSLPPGLDGRAADRTGRNWLQRAFAANTGCDLIFADPDNGIRPVAHREPAHRAKAVKHAYLDELAAFAQRGQSVTVYTTPIAARPSNSRRAAGWPTSPLVCPWRQSPPCAPPAARTGSS
jgi:hypothetical protein